MKTLFFIIFILINTQFLNAQLQGQAKIDSLLKELPKMKEDTNGVNLFLHLTYNYISINPSKGIEYGKKGVKLARKINWKKGEADCYKSLGLSYSRKSNYPKALEFNFKALKKYEESGNEKIAAGVIHNIGNIYSNLLDISKALEYYEKAKEINEKPDGNKLWLANNLGAIGTIYQSQSNYPKAMEYFLYSLKMSEDLGVKNRIAMNLGSIGTLYADQKNFIKALEYYNKALKIDKELENKDDIARHLGNIGDIYLNLSQDLILSTINEESELVSLNKEINLNRSIKYSRQSIEIYEELGELHSRYVFLKNLSDAYAQKGDYKNAFETYKEYKTLQDSVFSSENQTKIATLEAKRESELKEKEIVILKKEKENQKLQRYAMFGGIAGLGIIIGLILIQRRKSEKLLLNVLPAKIAKRLKAKEHPIADHFDGASIIFIDIVGFTKLSSDADPKRVVSVLNDIFTIFDKLADKYGLEKIKTIGDAYMAVCGIPEINSQHAKQAALMALEVKKIMTGFTTSDGTEIHFRIGIDCGAVVAGVIGEKKFIYDLWSDAVNTASRMESTGESGQIQITENFKSELEKFDGNWNFTLRGEFEIKGKGIMKTYFLEENREIK